MTDIVSSNDGEDMGIYDTQTPRAANILSVQLGALEYAEDLGIDLKYFLSEDFRFQNESFRAYLIEVLANQGINVSSVLQVIEALFTTYQFNITPEENGGSSLIAR